MDDPGIPLETKWAAIAQQLETKAEFRCFALLNCIELPRCEDSKLPPPRHHDGRKDRVVVLRGVSVSCRQQLSRLFQLAGESSKAVLECSSNPAGFWKSEHTQNVIAQEEALKRHLYLQMLRSSTA
jgi:hypothetical protein